jgi:Mn-containing catalase
MFHHAKELQFNARVSGPDPRFARLLLEQFGGGNGELKAAMQYFTQAFGVRQLHPDKYDLLGYCNRGVQPSGDCRRHHNDASGHRLGGTEGNRRRVGATRLIKGQKLKDEMLGEALANPQFLVLSGGGPTVTDANGHPWSGSFVNANGDLTVDLRSNIAAEPRDRRSLCSGEPAFSDDARDRSLPDIHRGFE